MKKLIKLLSSRLFWFVLTMGLQFIVLIIGSFYVSNNTYLLLALLLISLLCALFVSTRDESPDYKNAWMLIIVVFPLAGGLLYLIFGKKKIGRTAVRKILLTRDISRYGEKRLPSSELDEKDAKQIAYIHSVTGFQAFDQTAVKYYSFPDDFFDDVVREIRKAEKFIFIEYFIIAQGRVWTRILHELQLKRREGVDIRILYDDLGSINAVPKTIS